MITLKFMFFIVEMWIFLIYFVGCKPDMNHLDMQF